MTLEWAPVTIHPCSAVADTFSKRPSMGMRLVRNVIIDSITNVLFGNNFARL